MVEGNDAAKHGGMVADNSYWPKNQEMRIKFGLNNMDEVRPINCENKKSNSDNFGLGDKKTMLGLKSQRGKKQYKLG